MKTNLHIVRALCTMLLECVLFLWPAVAGQGTDERIFVRQNVFGRTGDSVKVNMHINLNNVAFQRKAYILLTPVVHSEIQSIELPAILINGKQQQRAYERSVNKRKKKNRNNKPLHTVIDASDNNRKEEHDFIWTIPYKPWMVAAEFQLREDQCDCNVYPIRMSYEILDRTLEGIAESPIGSKSVSELSVTFVVPETETVKQRSESGKALYFPELKSVLMPGYRNNVVELERIDEMIRMVQSNPNAIITEICIDGYASPEGMYRMNLELSEERAKTLKNYIKKTYGFDDRIFTVKGMGPDWDSLDSLLQQSDIPYKKEALAIIRHVDIFDGRRGQLMMLGSGMPYNLMAERFFPFLRRCDYKLKYTVLPFTVEKGKEVFKTHPSSLSLNEMFLIAGTYEKGSNEFNELFETAAHIFPDNDVANINAAAAALNRKDIASAGQYLGRVKERHAAFLNNMGVLLFMQGHRTEAEQYFSDARNLGNSEAMDNGKRMMNNE